MESCTPVPRHNPRKMLVTKFISEKLLPAAASAVDPASCPSMIVSATL